MKIISEVLSCYKPLNAKPTDELIKTFFHFQPFSFSRELRHHIQLTGHRPQFKCERCDTVCRFESLRSVSKLHMILKYFCSNKLVVTKNYLFKIKQSVFWVLWLACQSLKMESWVRVSVSKSKYKSSRCQQSPSGWPIVHFESFAKSNKSYFLSSYRPAKLFVIYLESCIQKKTISNYQLVVSITNYLLNRFY